MTCLFHRMDLFVGIPCTTLPHWLISSSPYHLNTNRRSIHHIALPADITITLSPKQWPTATPVQMMTVFCFVFASLCVHASACQRMRVTPLNKLRKKGRTKQGKDFKTAKRSFWLHTCTKTKNRRRRRRRRNIAYKTRKYWWEPQSMHKSQLSIVVQQHIL